MKTLLRTLAKVRLEIGFNFFRVFTGLAAVLYHSARSPAKAAITVLSQDRNQLLTSFEGQPPLPAAMPFARSQSRFSEPDLEELLELITKPDSWRSVVRRLALLATSEWDMDPSDAIAALNERPDSYFRYHELNRGNNDRWEYYLVPWHRTFGFLAIALLDDRLVEGLDPIRQRFDRWFREERPWMTRFTTGSNVSAVNAGYALHALTFFLHSGQPEYADAYERHSRRLHKALEVAFDTDELPSGPMEGVLYGSFWMETVIVLGLIQRQLGLHYQLLEQVEITGLSEYVWRSRTPDGDFQTSGDSRDFMGTVPSPMIFDILAAATREPYAVALSEQSDMPTHHLARALASV